MTELKGTYEVDLTWTPEEGEQMQGKLGGSMAIGGPPAGGGSDARPAGTAPDAPAGSIFSVVQEKLGLKLDPRKNPAEFLVIDHAEKAPRRTSITMLQNRALRGGADTLSAAPALMPAHGRPTKQGSRRVSTRQARVPAPRGVRSC